jgi:ATP-dependent RNA helicase RhlB
VINTKKDILSNFTHFLTILPLSLTLRAVSADLGFTALTPIQAQIPPRLVNQDAIGFRWLKQVLVRAAAFLLTIMGGTACCRPFFTSDEERYLVSLTRSCTAPTVSFCPANI